MGNLVQCPSTLLSQIGDSLSFLKTENPVQHEADAVQSETSPEVSTAQELHGRKLLLPLYLEFLGDLELVIDLKRDADLGKYVKHMKLDLRDPNIPFHIKVLGAKRFTSTFFRGSASRSQGGTVTDTRSSWWTTSYKIFGKLESESFNSMRLIVEGEHRYQDSLSWKTTGNPLLLLPNVVPGDTTRKGEVIRMNGKITVDTSSVMECLKSNGRARFQTLTQEIPKVTLEYVIRLNLNNTDSIQDYYEDDIIKKRKVSPMKKVVDPETGEVKWVIRCLVEMFLKVNDDKLKMQDTSHTLMNSHFYCDISVYEKDFDPRLIPEARKSGKKVLEDLKSDIEQLKSASEDEQKTQS